MSAGADKVQVGFIGLGVQGLPIALNILEAGYMLRGHDVRSEPMRELADAGGLIAMSIGEVAASGIIFVCVASDAQLIDVVTGPDGCIAHATPGTIIVSHCTIASETVAALAETCSKSGLKLVDAPVSGGERGARERSMSYIVGCDDDDFAVCEPLFRQSGKTILRTGDVGTATIAKLAHQVTILGNISAMAEGMRLGVAAGLAPDIVKQAITDGLARSWIANTWGEFKMAPHALPIYRKDLDNILNLAVELGIELPSAQIIRNELENIVP